MAYKWNCWKIKNRSRHFVFHATRRLIIKTDFYMQRQCQRNVCYRHTLTHIHNVSECVQFNSVELSSLRFGLVGHIKYAKYLVMCLSVCTFSILPDGRTDRQTDSIHCPTVFGVGMSVPFSLSLSLSHSELDCSGICWAWLPGWK